MEKEDSEALLQEVGRLARAVPDDVASGDQFSNNSLIDIGLLQFYFLARIRKKEAEKSRSRKGEVVFPQKEKDEILVLGSGNLKLKGRFYLKEGTGLKFFMGPVEAMLVSVS